MDGGAEVVHYGCACGEDATADDRIGREEGGVEDEGDEAEESDD